MVDQEDDTLHLALAFPLVGVQAPVPMEDIPAVVKLLEDTPVGGVVVGAKFVEFGVAN